MTFYEKVTSYFYISAVVEFFFFSNKHINRKKIQVFCLVLNLHLALEFVDILLQVPEQFLAVGPKAPKSYILIISLHERYPAHTAVTHGTCF